MNDSKEKSLFQVIVLDVAKLLRKAKTRDFILGKASDDASSTSSWLKGFLLIPEAKLLIHERPMVFMPNAFATIASGIVDIPTASAPNLANALISAGVSNAGPDKPR